MVVALALRLKDHARLLKQVVDDAPAGNAAVGVELDGDELPEPRRVVVPHLYLFSSACERTNE